MDYSLSLPPAMKTAVVIPTLLSDPANVEDLLESLEVRFLGNQDKHLYFGLLTDFVDAHEETLAGDEPLLRQARNGIEKLNEKYRRSGNDRFFLCHRPRRWNPTERLWMGYERKRGKLADLNALLRGGARDRFSLVVGDLAAMSDVRYVITLDTDTQLPRDSARQFVGAMAHPLNRPRFDERRQRVNGGYGILQPRMAASLPAANRSRYARLFGSEPGIDPYTRSVSDVYQDLFGEGSFIGKGIYDVDAFERALKDRFPENRILSHDLLEGCYARSGLLSDVHLYEEYPARYEADTSRQERWIRGDWQIAHWLLPRVPGPQGRSLPNPLSALSRWKILDNLRRSLVPAALMLLLMLGWYLAPQAWSWTLAVIGIVLIPPLLLSVVAIVQQAQRSPARPAPGRRHCIRPARTSSGRASGSPAFPTRRSSASRRSCARPGACCSRGGTCWSGVPTTKQQSTATDLVASYRALWSAPLLATVTAAGLAILRPGALVVAAPILCLWLAAPALAWWLSRPLVRRAAQLTVDQALFLRRIARKTWAFFERFVVADDHWLPPDNFQEHPGPAIAHRTSPTNMGLTLLANLAACDFGYIPAGGLLQRTEDAFRTMESLERHQGHFYNWYDTQTLLPLPPRYISSVDSGNLAGHLLTLRAGLLALPEQEIVGARLFDGLADTLGILAATVDRRRTATRSPDCSRCWMPAAPRGRRHSKRCSNRSKRWHSCALAHPRPATMTRPDERGGRHGRVHSILQCEEAQSELQFLAPWVALAAVTNGFDALPELGEIPTLRELADGAHKALLAIDARLPAGPPRRTSGPGWTNFAGWSRPAVIVQRTASPPSRHWRGRRPNLPRWSTSSCTTGRVICWRSGTTSTSPAATPASTTCWLRRRGCAASSPSPRESCRRKAGSRSAGC